MKLSAPMVSISLFDLCRSKDPHRLWKPAIQVNLFGTWLFCRHILPELRKAGGGSIIDTNSIAAVRGFPVKDAYACAKGGVGALTQSMAIKFGPEGIRVNAIAPGIVLTERARQRLGTNITIPQSTLDRLVLGPQEPWQIAEAALFLASDASAGITRQIMPVDSGFSAG